MWKSSRGWWDGTDRLPSFVDPYTKNSQKVIDLQKSKPDMNKNSVEGKEQCGAWTHTETEVRIEFIKLEPFACQLDKRGALIPDDQVEHNRLWTYLHLKNVDKIKDETKSKVRNPDT